MNLLEKIKNLFKRTKALPPSQVEEQKLNKDNTWILNNTSNDYQPTELENNIERFLQAYYNRIYNRPQEQTINNYAEAYTALAGLNGKQITNEEYNRNCYHENELLQQLQEEKRYTVQTQFDHYGSQAEFYHIQSMNYKMPPKNEMVRIYLNCNNGNIAELAKVLLDNNVNENFYLKFNAINPNILKSRGEKIVLYCGNSDYQGALNLIEYVKQLRPDLFMESKNTLPFLQSINNTVSIARQPESDIYKSLNGDQKRVPASVNSFLANMLEDSYMNAVREIARNDPALGFLLTQECFYNETLYTKNYPYIDSKYHEYLLKSMAAKMGVLSQKNNIYIDGINYEEINRTQYDKTVEYH